MTFAIIYNGEELKVDYFVVYIGGEENAFRESSEVSSSKY
jgi:hypothetical protein